MRRERIIIAIGIASIVVALVLAGTFVVTVRPNADGTYAEAASSVRAPSYVGATNGQLTLRVNNVSDASDRAIAEVWTSLAPEARSAGVYFRELTPSPGQKNLIANVTVINAQPAAVPFSYTDFFMVGRDGLMYYSNYAVCNSSCSADALKNRTLPESFASELYVLFSVPATTEATKLVYASSPPIVLTLS